MAFLRLGIDYDGLYYLALDLSWLIKELKQWQN